MTNIIALCDGVGNFQVDIFIQINKELVVHNIKMRLFLLTILSTIYSLSSVGQEVFLPIFIKGEFSNAYSGSIYISKAFVESEKIDSIKIVGNSVFFNLKNIKEESWIQVKIINERTIRRFQVLVSSGDTVSIVANLDTNFSITDYNRSFKLSGAKYHANFENITNEVSTFTQNLPKNIFTNERNLANEAIFVSKMQKIIFESESVICRVAAFNALFQFNKYYSLVSWQVMDGLVTFLQNQNSSNTFQNDRLIEYKDFRKTMK